jgi:hypothetical protein
MPPSPGSLPGEERLDSDLVPDGKGMEVVGDSQAVLVVDAGQAHQRVEFHRGVVTQEQGDLPDRLRGDDEERGAEALFLEFHRRLSEPCPNLLENLFRFQRFPLRLRREISLLIDDLLQLDDAVDERLGAGGAPGDVDVSRSTPLTTQYESL